jgi:hypothetical protein
MTGIALVIGVAACCWLAIAVGIGVTVGRMTKTRDRRG